MDYNHIIEKLPYSKPFLFVDSLTHVDSNGVQGSFCFHKELDFYRGHFKNQPITPGVILTECCAQIGLVCLGIYLLSETPDIKINDLDVGFSSSEMEFYLSVYPGEKVSVFSEKIYFRFNKLKCKVKMYNAAEKLVCKGELAGMIKNSTNGT
ncbi:hydroxymyristoyl-ACP dehydratase [uncultured Eudoraea sp.]|uniref:3-hydroxyacyl-ACP dehydratase FabZ family protein n=1 Tax=uncultured Eudoraea sp. TaxID=1035614 RepID=UPI0026030490|nr:hydroxymyristoyl-ACP dehydratase [uncultured Eudoraea sp.]